MHCCFIEPETEESCERKASVEIIDNLERRPDCAVTHACFEHVYELLGHQVDLDTTGQQESWTVVLLSTEEGS